MKRNLEVINAVILTIMFLTTLFQVVARMVFTMSTVWSEELARYLFVCLTFLGAVPLMQTDQHIRMGFLTDRLKGRSLALVRLIGLLLTVPFIGAMTWSSWANARANWETYMSSMEWLSIGYIYLIMCMAGILMLGCLGVNLIRQFRVEWGLARTEGADR